MSSVLSLMEKLNYPHTKEGVCLGVAYMAERARRLGQFKAFQERMAFIKTVDEGTIVKELGEIKAWLKRSALNTKTIDEAVSQLDDNDKMYMSLEPFFWQISARMYPDKISESLELNGPELTQFDYSQQIEPILYDPNSYNLELSPLAPPKSFFIHANKDEIIEESELTRFLNLIQFEPEFSAGLLIYSGNHAIHVFYDELSQEWVLTNHDTIVKFDNTNDLSLFIRNIFSENSTCNLAIEIYTNEYNENADILFSQLENVSNQSVARMINENVFNQQDSSGISAIEIAIKSGFLNTVQKLLATNKIEIKDLDKNKLLYKAIVLGRKEIAIALIKYYENKKIALPSIPEACKRAFERNDMDVVQFLLKSPMIVAKEYLHAAVELGSKELLQPLLDTPNINVNFRKEGYTPLYLAVELGHLELVQMFLSMEKIEVNDTYIASSPLILAAQSGRLDILRELLNHKKIDVNYRNQFSGTALGKAIEYLREDCVTELLNKPGINANVIVDYYRPDDTNNKNRLRFTGPGLAIELGNIEIVKQLLKHPTLDVNLLSEVDGKKCSSLGLLINSDKFNEEVKRDLVYLLLANGYDSSQVPDYEKDLVADYLQKKFKNINVLQPFLQLINLFEKKFQALSNTEEIRTEIDGIRAFIKENSKGANPDLITIHTRISNLLDQTATRNYQPTLFASNNNDSVKEMRLALDVINNASRTITQNNP